MLAAIDHARTIRERLRNPPNAKPDQGIDLKRKVIPIAAIVDVQETEIAEPVSLIDLQLAKAREATPEIFQRTDISLIQKIVATHFAVERDDILGPSRRQCVVWPRQVAMYLVRRIALASLPYIGMKFGGRDHTTAIYAVRKVERLRSDDLALDAELSELEAQIRDLRPIST